MGKTLRLWTLLLGGVLASSQLYAQNPGDDFTSKIVNPGFEGAVETVSGPNITGGGNTKAPEGWTLSKALGGWNDIDIRINSTDGENPPYEGQKHFNLWKGNVIELELNQRITFPAGQYELSAAMKMTNNEIAYLTDQHIFATSLVDGITYKSSVLSVVGEGNWEVLKVIFKVKEDQEVLIGAASTGNGAGPSEERNSASWFCLDDFRLTYLGEPGELDIHDVLAAIQARMDLANTYPSSRMPRGTYNAMIDMMAIASDVTTSTPIEEAQKILADLNELMILSDEGILLYDTLYAVTLKAFSIPETYEGYDAFLTVLDKSLDIMSGSQSMNQDFQEAITELREAYYTININDMSTATADEGKNATWLMENPNYTVDGGDHSSTADASFDFWNMSWTYSGYNDNWLGNGIVSSGPAEDEKVNAYQLNGWSFSVVNVVQEVSSLPEGAYTLSCDIRAYSGDPSTMRIFAQSNYEERSAYAEYLYNSGEGEDPATDWWQTLTTDKIYVSEDGLLKIGFNCVPPPMDGPAVELK